MKITFAELKLRARRSLVGNFGTLTGVQIIVYAVSVLMIPLLYLVMIPFIFSLALANGGVAAVIVICAAAVAFIVVYCAMLAVTALLGAGFARIMLDIAQAEPAEFKQLLFPFKNHFLRFAGITGIFMVFGMLSAVPGILLEISTPIVRRFGWLDVLVMLVQYALIVWVMTSFSQSFHILLEDPEKKAVQCMRESYEMMKGNRARLFLLQLSFIGWYFLIGLSFGIGAVWILPYIGCTSAHFYLDLRERRRLLTEGWTEEMETEPWNSQS